MVQELEVGLVQCVDVSDGAELLRLGDHLGQGVRSCEERAHICSDERSCSTVEVNTHQQVERGRGVLRDEC